MGVPIVTVGRDLRVRWASPEARRLLNLSVEDAACLITDAALGLGPRDLKALVLRTIRKAEVQRLEVRAGGGLWHLLSIRPYRPTGRAVEGALLMLTDINQWRAKGELRKAFADLEVCAGERAQDLRYALGALQTEIAKRQIAENGRVIGEHRVRSLWENASDALFTLDVDSNILDVNPAMEQILGCTAEEARRLNLRQIIDLEDLARFCQALEGPSAGVGTLHEMSIRAKDGRRIPMEIRSRPFHEDGRPAGLHCVGRDIRERRRGEREVRRLELELTRLQDDERRRLARELHDTTGQNLAALRMNLDALLNEVGPVERIRELTVQSLDLTDQCLQEVRTLSYVLHPPLLDERGLSSALREYIDGFAERSGIAVDLEIPQDLGRLPADIEVAAFRAVQECLTNVNRHSGSRTARILVGRTDSRLMLEISAEGRGFRETSPGGITEAEGQGLGLRSMRERLRPLGGRLEIDFRSSGSLVRVLLPLGGAEFPFPSPVKLTV